MCDAETGEYEFVSPGEISSLGERTDPQTELDEAYGRIQAEHEAMLGGTGNGEERGGEEPAAVAGDEAPQTAAEAQQPQMTEEQMQQYAKGAFDEATHGNGGITLPEEHRCGGCSSATGDCMSRSGSARRRKPAASLPPWSVFLLTSGGRAVV